MDALSSLHSNLSQTTIASANTEVTDVEEHRFGV